MPAAIASTDAFTRAKSSALLAVRPGNRASVCLFVEWSVRLRIVFLGLPLDLFAFFWVSDFVCWFVGLMFGVCEDVPMERKNIVQKETVKMRLAWVV